MKKIMGCMLCMVALISAHCTKDNPVQSKALVVVRGFLYAGEAVTDIQLTQTIALGSEETTVPPINEAAVTLIKNNVRYNLVASAGDSGYYHYPGTDLVVAPGDQFTLEAEYGSVTATAETSVPFPPDSVVASTEQIAVSSTLPQPGSAPGADSSQSLVITWKRDASPLFYVVVENLDANPDTIGTFGGGPGGNPGGRRTTSQPQSTNRYSIRGRDLSYYGHYVARIYRVNQEYADLYQSRTQDSRDLNEPLTNIINGLGVFSAFASKDIYFTVVAE
jgi:hypothetical protein